MKITYLKITFLIILCFSFCTTVFSENYDGKFENVINITAPYISDENKDEEISRRDCIEIIMKLIGVDQKTAEYSVWHMWSTACFADIEYGNEENGYIILARINDIAEGEKIPRKTDPMFYPNRSVTTKECLAFMLRCLKDRETVEWDNIISDSKEIGLLPNDVAEDFSENTPLLQKDFCLLLYSFLNQNRYIYFDSGQIFVKYDTTNSVKYIDQW